MGSQLHEIDPIAFPMGPNSASIGELAFKMLSSSNVISESQLMCTACDYTEDEVDHDLGYTLIAHGDQQKVPLSTLKWVAELEKPVTKKCPDCSSSMVKQFYYTDIPKLLVFEYPNTKIKTSHK